MSEIPVIKDGVIPEPIQERIQNPQKVGQRVIFIFFELNRKTTIHDASISLIEGVGPGAIFLESKDPPFHDCGGGKTICGKKVLATDPRILLPHEARFLLVGNALRDYLGEHYHPDTICVIKRRINEILFSA